MWKNTIISLGLMGALALAACRPIDLPQQPASGNTDSAPDPSPVITHDPSPTPTPGSAGQPLPTSEYAPQPGDSALVRDTAYVDSAELLQLESFPVQTVLKLTGSLPTPCHQLRVAVPQPDAQGNIAVEVYSVVDPNRICAQVLKELDASVPLTGLAPGGYTVLVNGEQVGEFVQ
ncbi:MAG: hypothetical protein ACT4QE_26045 [Anaerolineales bacterium]